MIGTPNSSLQDLKLWRCIEGKLASLDQKQQQIFQEKSTWFLNNCLAERASCCCKKPMQKILQAHPPATPPPPPAKLVLRERWLKEEVGVPGLTQHWVSSPVRLKLCGGPVFLLQFLCQWDTTEQATPQVDFFSCWCVEVRQNPLIPLGLLQILGFRRNSRKGVEANFNKNKWNFKRARLVTIPLVFIWKSWRQ